MPKRPLKNNLLTKSKPEMVIINVDNIALIIKEPTCDLRVEILNLETNNVNESKLASINGLTIKNIAGKFTYNIRQHLFKK